MSDKMIPTRIEHGQIFVAIPTKGITVALSFSEMRKFTNDLDTLIDQYILSGIDVDQKETDVPNVMDYV